MLAIDAQTLKFIPLFLGNIERMLSPYTTLGRNGAAMPAASSRPRGRASKPSRQQKGCAKKSYSEPPPAMVCPTGGREHRPGEVPSGVRDGSHNNGPRQGKIKRRDCDEEAPDGEGDLSESSLSGDDGGSRKRPADLGRSQKGSSLPGAALESSSQNASLVRAFAVVSVVDLAHTCSQQHPGQCWCFGESMLPCEDANR